MTSKSPTQIKTELDAAEAELAEVYRRLWPLREAYAEAVPPAALPSRRNRTAKQELIARCPRCGGRLTNEPPSDRNPLTPPTEGE